MGRDSRILEISVKIHEKIQKMTVIIDKNNSKNISKIQLGKRKKTGNLAKHFGKLKRKIDGLEYQLDVRKN